MNNISGVNSIESILEDNGYPIKRGADYISTSAIFRGGDNNTAICIYPEKNLVIDFVTSEKYSINTLVGKILGIEGEDNINEYLSNNNLNFTPSNDIQEPLIKNENKVFSPQDIQDFGIVPNYDYWTSREISKETAQLFHGGLAYRGRMKNRQVLTIYDSKDQIIGFTGRSVLKDYKIKWKHLGVKKNWVFPAYLNSKIIQEQKEVILVESPGCVLKLWDCGIKNAICLFGLECSFAIVNYLLRLNDVTIYISTNNEESNRGNDAAAKIERKLLRYFDKKNIVIKLPFKKDFGEMSNLEILRWISNG